MKKFKIQKSSFKGKTQSNQKLRDFALKYFGEHSGLAHLYMFCYERKAKINQK